MSRGPGERRDRINKAGAALAIDEVEVTAQRDLPGQARTSPAEDEAAKLERLTEAARGRARTARRAAEKAEDRSADAEERVAGARDNVARAGCFAAGKGGPRPSSALADKPPDRQSDSLPRATASAPAEASEPRPR
jgi:hypothetical protein